MNLEHLCRTIRNNSHRLRDKKKALRFLRYQFELLAWKKNKLKLGAIVFEIKEVMFHQTVLWEEIEIRYIRQDTSVEDERKVENILKRLGWKWDVKNVIAFIVVAYGAFYQLCLFLRIQYIKRLPTLALRFEHYDYVLKYGFETSFSPYTPGTFQRFANWNYWIVDTLTDFCTYFNIIF